MTIPSSQSLILWISVFSITSPSADFRRLWKTLDFFGRLRTSSGIFGNDRVVFKNPGTPRIKISRLYLRKSWQVLHIWNWLMERSCIFCGTVDWYIGEHLGISVYRPLCWLMLSQLLEQHKDRPTRGSSPEFQASSVNLLLRGTVSAGGFSSKFSGQIYLFVFFALFSALHDWIVLILSWFERSFSPAQVKWQCSPWPLKLMMSQGIQGV